MRYREYRWSRQRVSIAVVVSVLVLGLGLAVPFLPLGVLLWMDCALVAYMWPRPDRYPPNEVRKIAAAEWVKQYEHTELWTEVSTLRHWRIGPSGDHNKYALNEKAQQAGWLRPVTICSVSATAAAAMLAGLDLLVTAFLRSVPATSTQWFDYSGRSVWVAAGSALSGWLFVKTVAEVAHRRLDPNPDKSAIPPTSVMAPAADLPPSKWLRAALKSAALKVVGVFRRSKSENAEPEVPSPEFPSFNLPSDAAALPVEPPGGSPSTELSDVSDDEAAAETSGEPKRRVLLLPLRAVLAVVKSLSRRAGRAWKLRHHESGWWRLLSLPSLLMFVTAASTAYAAVVALTYVTSINSNAVTALTVGALLLSGGTGLAASSWLVLRKLSKEQQQKWLDWLLDTRRWDAVWANFPQLAARPPQFVHEVKTPESADEPYVKRTFFQLRAGTEWGMIESVASKLTSSLTNPNFSPLVAVSRITQSDNPQAVSLSSFEVSQGLVQFPPESHLRGELENEGLAFAVREAMTRAFTSVKLGYPTLVGGVEVMSHTGTRQPPQALAQESTWEPAIFRSTWLLPRQHSYEAILKATDQLRDRLSCQWLRISRSEDESTFTIYFGARPEKCRFRGERQQKKVMRRVLSLDWEYWFRLCAVQVGGGTPTLVSSVPMKLGDGIRHTFSLPAGMDVQRVRDKASELRAASGKPYLEVEEGDTPTLCHILIGDVDPLDSVYLFRDHADKLLRVPKRGEAQIDFVVGMGREGELLTYEWDHEQPHLLIAGSSGAGKSGLLNSMLCQLCSNNTSDDLELWMLEPKNELQAYQHLEHVKFFASTETSAMSDFESAAIMFERAVEEMTRRYTMFATHRERPQKLATARRIAMQDPASSELMLPYLIIIMEECSSYLQPPSLPEDRKHHKVLEQHATEIARKGRAAGIHCCWVTQYPTKQGMPTTIKQQCRPIGLSTANVTASMVVIDDVGLEDIRSKGRGLVKIDGRLIPFRSLLMEAPDVDERQVVLSRLPVSTNWPKLPEGIEPSPLVTMGLESFEEELKVMRDEARRRWDEWLEERTQRTRTSERGRSRRATKREQPTSGDEPSTLGRMRAQLDERFLRDVDRRAPASEDNDTTSDAPDVDGDAGKRQLNTSDVPQGETSDAATRRPPRPERPQRRPRPDRPRPVARPSTSADAEPASASTSSLHDESEPQP